MSSAEDVGGLLGEIRLFAGNFAPAGWLECDGRTLSIPSNNALFAVLGKTYGGDGSTTFALPDLRGRSPLGIGQGEGLSRVDQGEKGGSEKGQTTTTLRASQIPAHPHDFNVATTVADSDSPDTSTTLAGHSVDGSFTNVSLFRKADATKTMTAIHSATISSANKPADPISFNLPTRSPYLGLRYIICVEGLFPSRP